MVPTGGDAHMADAGELTNGTPFGRSVDSEEGEALQAMFLDLDLYSEMDYSCKTCTSVTGDMCCDDGDDSAPLSAIEQTVAQFFQAKKEAACFLAGF
jgi:hypothetical protein